MNNEQGDFVMPGDVVGVSEQYLPNKWTYEEEGFIKAAVMGNVSIEQHKIAIVPKTTTPLTLEVGDTITGQITNVIGQRALVDIQTSIDSSRELALPYSGAIHISQINKGYLERLNDAFRIGDIVEGKVVKVINDSIDLNTESSEHGVIKAMCTQCRHFMIPSKTVGTLYCENCNRKEKRKISSNYEY
ncbi:MAG: exosome complex RNA-binding protein Csl4 [Methanobrevibacter sp.]|jgi:exosome complex component CSL4|nr:exosome complex RNA-binding protein Csl4 [Methanobrevibacter sp.]